MAIGHISQRRLIMSRVPQTNYATPTLPVTVPPLAFRVLPIRDQNLAGYGVQTRDNRGHATGRDFPTDQWLISHDVSRPVELDVDADSVGRLLLGALGSVVTTQPDAVGAPLVYRHVFRPQDEAVSRQLPAYTLVEKLGAILDRLFPGCVVESFGLRGEGLERISGSAAFRGSGKRTSPSGVNLGGGSNHVQDAVGLSYFFNSQVELQVRDAGTLANNVPYGSTKRIETWAVGVENNLLADVGYRAGSGDFQTPGVRDSGSVRSELLFGDRNFTSEFVARMDSGSDEFAALQSQKSLDVLVELTGALIEATFNFKLSIRFRLARYAAVELGNSAGIVTVAIRPTPLWDTTANEIVSFTLDNTTPSYTT
jgi:hypothetical protein